MPLNRSKNVVGKCFSHFDRYRTAACDVQVDGQSDVHGAIAYTAHSIASRGKKTEHTGLVDVLQLSLI